MWDKVLTAGKFDNCDDGIDTWYGKRFLSRQNIGEAKTI